MDSGAESYRRYLDGDDEALADLVEAYKDGLILFLNGFVKNPLLAEELTEDTFFRLITKKPKFSGKSSFKSWLYAIGRNTAVDHLRRHAKQIETPIELLETYQIELASLEQSYLIDERKAAVHAAMCKLPPDYERALWLVYFEDFSNREAAAAMKKSDRQIRNLLYRAKQSLKEILRKEGFSDEDL